MRNTNEVAVPTFRGKFQSQAIYFAKNIKAGNNIVTVTFNIPAAYVNPQLAEYAGLDQASPFYNGGNRIMFFNHLYLHGAYLIEPERHEDSRGFFARVFCESEFKEKGLEYRFVQCSVSFNKLAGTLRGMHFQIPPFDEVKLVRCTRGNIFEDRKSVV
jgi:hypothetical protein